MPFLRDAVTERLEKARTEGIPAFRNRTPRCDGMRLAASVRATADHRMPPPQVGEGSKGIAGLVLPPGPRASNCPGFVRKRIAARLPELCEALIELALAGDLRAAKLLWQMAELDRKTPGPPAGSGRTKTAVGFAQKALAEFRAR